MTEHQKLGGTRQSSPLEDEMTYPLTQDEYMTLRENLVLDKFSNWESFLLSTLITTLISGFVIYFTGSVCIVDKTGKEIINISQIVTLIIYGAISFGSLIGLITSKIDKKKSETPLERLDARITQHLSKS